MNNIIDLNTNNQPNFSLYDADPVVLTSQQNERSKRLTPTQVIFFLSSVILLLVICCLSSQVWAYAADTCLENNTSNSSSANRKQCVPPARPISDWKFHTNGSNTATYYSSEAELMATAFNRPECTITPPSGWPTDLIFQTGTQPVGTVWTYLNQTNGMPYTQQKKFSIDCAGQATVHNSYNRSRDVTRYICPRGSLFD